MRRTNLRKLIPVGAILVVVLAGILILLSGKTAALCLDNAEDGTPLYQTEATSFSVFYTHSVNKSLVTEYYEIRDGVMYLTALRYSAFGAGMPTEPLEDQTVRYEDDAMIIEGYERPMPQATYFVGRVSNVTLDVNGEQLPLTELAAPGTPVTFSVRLLPRLTLWLQ